MWVSRRGVAARALRKPCRASAASPSSVRLCWRETRAVCAHNVHQLNRYTTPEKHSSVCRRRQRHRSVSSRNDPPPASRSTHSSDAAASGANCGIARNRSTGRGVAPWDTCRASCTIMPLRLPSIRPFLLFSSCVRARVCWLMSRAPRQNEGSELGVGRSEEKWKSHDRPAFSVLAAITSISV
jgi:hypothetical protein